MSRPIGGRGKITAKLAASANQNRQEMNGDDGDWSVVQKPQQGLQPEASGTSGDSWNTNGGDEWGAAYTDAWNTNHGQFDLDSNTPAKDDIPPEECIKCSGPHASRDCDKGPSNNYGGGGGGNREGGGRGECYGCGQTGHIRRDCPQNSGNRSMGGSRPYGEDRSSGGQRVYGNGGNRSYESDRSRGASNSTRGNAQCSNCGGRGHDAAQCPSPPMEGNDSAYGGSQSSRGSSYVQQSDITCHRCNEQGHFAHQCPKRVGAQTDTENTGPLNRVIETTEEEAHNRNRIGDMSHFEKTEVKVFNSEGENCNRFDNKVLRTFRDGGLCDSLLQMLERLGFEKPMPVQKYAIPILSEGYDIMACAQTGSGKTAAFILPIVDGLIKDRRPADRGNPQRPYGLVLSPTRELCVQITRDAQQYVLKTNPRIKVKECYGGTNVREQRRNICEGCHLLVGTTGRVKQFLQENVICFSELRYLVLDEADRMLDMGFKSDVREIMAFRKRESPLQTLMFSATFPSEVQNLARDYLRPDFVKLDVGVVGMVNQDVRQTVEQVQGMEAKKSRLVTMVEEDISRDKHAKILVFTATKVSADAMAVYLSTSGIKTTSMHGDRLQEQRETALADFQNGECPVLVATEVAGRGLDITNVTHVINFDLPKDIDGYIHRVGRTARAGKTGRATSFFDPAKDYAIKDDLRHVLLEAGQVPPEFL